ncbi:hypothetical protein AWB81_08459 [Caballeronia arationis]|nr:hypothetical protein AWB81_08459 [Caballeronia arationis]
MLRIRRSGVVPAFEQRVLLRQHQFKRMQRRIGLLQRLFEQAREAFAQPSDGECIEQVGGVAETAGQPVLLMSQAQGEIELGAGFRCGQQLQREPGQGERFHRRVLQYEHDLEQRRAAGVANRRERLDQLLERQILMGVGGKRCVTDLREQLAQGGCAREIGTQHQRIDEQADERLDLRVSAIGDGRAHSHLRLSGQAREQGLEHGEHQHEGRHAFALSERIHALVQLGTHGKGQRRATSADLRGTGSIGGQIQRCEPGELGAPVLTLALEFGAGEPVALPQGVVGVLHGQRRQGEGFVAQRGRIAGTELAHQHAGGPAIGDDVMHREQQHVLVLREAQQLCAQQRPVLKIKGAGGFDLREAPHFGGLRIGGERVEHAQRQRELQLCRDALHSLAVMLREGGAQALVTGHQGVEGGLEGGHIECTAQAQGHRDVVGGLSGVELLEEPQAFLCKGQRQACGAVERLQGRQCAGLTRRILLQSLGERGDAGRIEQGAQGQFNRQGFAQPRDELRSEQRVAAECEEVIEDAHTLQA